MSEFTPQFTYDPDGILTVRIDYEDAELYEGAVRKGQERAVNSLGEHKGVVIEDGNDTAVASIDVQEALGSSFNNRGDDKILNFLKHLSLSLPYHPEGPTDRIASLDSITTHGTFAGIFPQFQRWLNAEGITEETAKESVLAMAMPFGKATKNKAAKDFKEYGGSASAWAFGISVHPDTFGLRKEEATPDTIIETNGEVKWDWVYLSTLGSCACWGVNGDDRRNISVSPEVSRLYQMTPHNVDFARQMLSHILGLGVLSHQAAEYAGQEDIFAEVEWEEPREYQRNPLKDAFMKKRNK